MGGRSEGIAERAEGKTKSNLIWTLLTLKTPSSNIKGAT